MKAKLNHHKFRFGIKGNFKVLLCRVFGHKLNSIHNNHWCERCGLAYEEIYYPKNYRNSIESKFSIVINGDNGEISEISIPFTLYQLIKIAIFKDYQKVINAFKIIIEPKKEYNDKIQDTLKIKIAFPIKEAYCSENYVLIIKDNNNVDHYFDSDGSYDGNGCSPDKDSQTGMSLN